MVRIHLYDRVKDTYISSTDWPGIPRIGEEVYYDGVACRVSRVVWSAGNPIVCVHVTPLEERLLGKVWWSE